MLYFSKIQDDSYRIIAPISCIMASFHKLNQTDIVGCVLGGLSSVLTTVKETNKVTSKPLCQWTSYAATLKKISDSEGEIYQGQE